MIQKIVSLIFLLFLLSGCRLLSPQPSTPIFPPTMNAPITQASKPAEPTSTPQPFPSPTITPKATATDTPFVPIQGMITVDNIKLRSGPGFLFDTVSLYPNGDRVLVYGRSQGDNWYFVQTSDSRSGWMKMEFVALAGSMDDLPVIAYTDANVINGHVRNKTGEPMSDIGIIIFPVNSDNGTNSDNAVTDSSGSFYLFLPKNLRGDYTIGINAHSCSSNAVDAQCQFLYGYPSAQSITLPNTPGVSIEFVLPDLLSRPGWINSLIF